MKIVICKICYFRTNGKYCIILFIKWTVTLANKFVLVNIVYINLYMARIDHSTKCQSIKSKTILMFV